jgi:hypothetical protein
MNLDIYQLTKLLTKQKVLALGLFKDNKIDTETKYFLFYEKILSNEIRNDTEAKIALNYPKKSPAFLKFKERYTKKVLDYILLFEASIKSNEFINEEFYRLLKLYTAGKIILYKQQFSNATIIFKYIIDSATKHDFLDLQLYSSIELRKLYGFLKPDKKLFKFYAEKSIEIEVEFLKRLTLDQIYDKVSHDFTAIQLKDVDQFKKETLDKGVKLLEIIKDSSSIISKTKAYEIVSFAYTINNQLEDSINISKESISLLQQSESSPKYKIHLAYKDIVSAYLKLKDFDSATLYLHKTLALFTQKNINYFRMKSLEYLLYAFSKDYNNLFIITLEVLNSKELKQHNALLEEWKLREAFVNLLIEANKIDEKYLNSTKYKKFRLNRFLNEVNHFAKDKRGINISIHVVELMHFLIRKEYDKLIDRLDALNQYTYRYLRNDSTLRSNCFIKMLLKIPEAEYHPIRTARYVSKYEKKLLQNPLEILLKSVDVEIIPFENLWEIIIEILGLNLKEKKK